MRIMNMLMMMMMMLIMMTIVMMMMTTMVVVVMALMIRRRRMTITMVLRTFMIISVTMIHHYYQIAAFDCVFPLLRTPTRIASTAKDGNRAWTRRPLRSSASTTPTRASGSRRIPTWCRRSACQLDFRISMASRASSSVGSPTTGVWALSS